MNFYLGAILLIAALFLLDLVCSVGAGLWRMYQEGRARRAQAKSTQAMLDRSRNVAWFNETRRRRR